MRNSNIPKEVQGKKQKRKKVFELFKMGYSQKQIALELNLNVKTVASRLMNYKELITKNKILLASLRERLEKAVSNHEATTSEIKELVYSIKEIEKWTNKKKPYTRIN